jgi:hypothetical protein
VKSSISQHAGSIQGLTGCAQMSNIKACPKACVVDLGSDSRASEQAGKVDHVEFREFGRRPLIPAEEVIDVQVDTSHIKEVSPSRGLPRVRLTPDV